ncbi:glutamate receptor 4-like [Penaeus vannamei]|uniref:glutamate receptor 4-like n=1 Tax=Penaeus vannamei TaxID=6689 RepID=UPI00387F8A9F
MGNLLDIFADAMNASFELVRPPDRLWGIRLGNGTWNGMMGMVHRGEVEFALGPFAVTPQREEACDFSMEVHSDNQAIIMIRPGLQNDLSGFLKPFTLQVWVLILLSFLSIGLAMTLIVKAEGSVFQFPTENVLGKAAMWVVQTATQESSEWLPVNDGGRIVVATWLLASLVFMSSYSGILTAMLTVPRVTIPIDSLADLVAQDDLPWRLESGAMMLTYLEESEDRVRRTAFDKMSGTIPDCWSGREGIASGQFAAICDETSMRKAISWDFSTTGECHLYIARERVYSNIMMSLAFVNDSVYLEKANKIISTVKESGLLAKWMSQEISNTSLCLRPPTADRRDAIAALNINAFFGPLMVLMGGLGIAFLVFLAETLRQSLLESEDEIRQQAFLGMSGTISACWVARQAIAKGEFAVICDETAMKKAKLRGISEQQDALEVHVHGPPACGHALALYQVLTLGPLGLMGGSGRGTAPPTQQERWAVDPAGRATSGTQDGSENYSFRLHSDRCQPGVKLMGESLPSPYIWSSVGEGGRGGMDLECLPEAKPQAGSQGGGLEPTVTISSRLQPSVVEFTPDECIMVMGLKLAFGFMSLIAVYAPTNVC